MAYLYANDDTTPVGSMASTTALNDVAVDDQTTGPPYATDSDSYVGPSAYAAPCAGTLSATAIQSAVYDAGGPTAITEIRSTSRGFTMHSGIGVPCPSPPPVAAVTVIRVLSVSLDGSSWSVLLADTNTPLLGANDFETLVWTGSQSARYVKLVVTCQVDYFGITGTLEARAQNTDLQLPGASPGCTPPDVPTLSGIATLIGNTPTNRLTLT